MGVPGPRKSLAPVSFPITGCEQFTTFIFTVIVHQTGRLEYTAFIRMPYNNRPKKGGGKSVPWSWINNKSMGRFR